MKDVSFQEWKALRHEAQARVSEERSQHANVAQPPLQVAVTDRIIRDLLGAISVLDERITEVENRSGRKAK